MRDAKTNPGPAPDSTGIALRALVWTLGEQDRAQRLLDTTGLDPADLRARASEPAVLSAVLGFLESWEPDLVACAEGIDVAPAAIVAAHAELDA